jgi:drug/metabolite transporter (DMT)-like permease
VRAVDYALTLVAALVLGVGFVLQQHAAEQAPKSYFLSLKLIADLFRKRLWLAGIVAMIVGQVLAAWSIGNLELSIVEPLLTTNLLFALILAVPLSHQAVRVTEVAGALLLIAGEGLLELARSAQPIGQSFGSFAHWPAAALIAGVAFAAIQAGRQRHDSRRATLTGLGAGLVFGIQDALTRQSLQILQHHGLSGLLQSWSAYCLVATGAVGVLLMQYAFSAGPLHASLPTIAAGEPVAGILLGIVVFGDRISLTPGSLAMQAGGLFALVVGVIAVARAPALTNLRKAVTEPVHLPHRPFREHRSGQLLQVGRPGQAGRPGQDVQDPQPAAHSPRTSAKGAVPSANGASGASGASGANGASRANGSRPAPAADDEQPGAAALDSAALDSAAKSAANRAAKSASGQVMPPGEPAGPIGPIEPGGPVSHIGPSGPGLMAPAQPPMAVPPDSPLEPL